MFALFKEFDGKMGERTAINIPRGMLSVQTGNFDDCTITKQSYRAYEGDELKNSRQMVVRPVDRTGTPTGPMDTLTMNKVIDCFSFLFSLATFQLFYFVFRKIT